jgi:hypothetical protein
VRLRVGECCWVCVLLGDVGLQAVRTDGRLAVGARCLDRTDKQRALDNEPFGQRRPVKWRGTRGIVAPARSRRRTCPTLAYGETVTPYG